MTGWMRTATPTRTRISGSQVGCRCPGGVHLADGSGAAGTGDGLLSEEPLGGGRGGHGPLLGSGAAAVDNGHEGDSPPADDVLVVPDTLDGDLVLTLGEPGLIETDRALVEVHRVGLVQAGGSITAQQRRSPTSRRTGDVAEEPTGSPDIAGVAVDDGLRAGARLLNRGGVVRGQQGVGPRGHCLATPGGGETGGGAPVLVAVGALRRGVEVAELRNHQRAVDSWA